MCLSGEPIQDFKQGSGQVRYERFQYHHTTFQVGMIDSPRAGVQYFGWFCFQCIPCTSPIAQYCLRRKALQGDMSKYVCFQGMLSEVCCCIKPNALGEKKCPQCCLCLEVCCCNSCAVSATRAYVMTKYDLMADPCDNRLIRCNNIIQVISCVCDLLAMINDSFRECAKCCDLLAQLMYCIVSGCMTAQVVKELDHQHEYKNDGNDINDQGEVQYTHYPHPSENNGNSGRDDDWKLERGSKSNAPSAPYQI